VETRSVVTAVGLASITSFLLSLTRRGNNLQTSTETSPIEGYNTALGRFTPFVLHIFRNQRPFFKFHKCGTLPACLFIADTKCDALGFRNSTT